MIDANYTNTKHGVDLSPFEHKAIKAERYGIMHRKFCVIDNNVLIHGSYNWTTNAETRNDELLSHAKVRYDELCCVFLTTSKSSSAS